MSEKDASRGLLLIERDESLRVFWERALRSEGFDVVLAKTPEQGVASADPERIQYVFLGTGLEGEEGIRTVLALRDRVPEIRILSPTNSEQVREFVATGNARKSAQVDHVRLSLRALEERRAAEEQASHQLDCLVCQSAAMKKVLEQISGVLKTNTTVLLLGETGTGKGMTARVMHYNSARREGPFVEVSCTSLPESLLESELFGHEAGAFTDARTRKLGLVEVASGGTLFLDEIGDMPLALQAKLLRLLEERSFRRVGGTAERKADARMILATHRSLPDLVKQGRFREDLYYRISVFPVMLPPLRERSEDVVLLAREFLRRFRSELARSVERISPEAERALLRYPWPGNIRELRNAMERAVLLCKGAQIEAQDLPVPVEEERITARSTTLDEMEREMIEKALVEVQGNQTRAAERLGITRFALRNRMRKHGIRFAE